MSQDGVGCKNCKRLREHVASLVFAEKLVNAPVYVEHVAVENAAGKVTKSSYDAASRSLLYEAEIYDQTIADKVRKCIIRTFNRKI
jgi:hypothetical protein